REKLLLDLVDVSGLAQNPVADYKIVTRELEEYSRQVAAKPKIVVATKLDAAPVSLLDEFKEFCEREGLEFHEISAITGQGLKELLRAVERRLDALRQEEREGQEEPKGPKEPKEPKEAKEIDEKAA